MTIQTFSSYFLPGHILFHRLRLFTKIPENVLDQTRYKSMQECKAVEKRNEISTKIHDMAFCGPHTQVITLHILEGCQEI